MVRLKSMLWRRQSCTSAAISSAVRARVPTDIAIYLRDPQSAPQLDFRLTFSPFADVGLALGGVELDRHVYCYNKK
jgi:hypothetical protein